MTYQQFSEVDEHHTLLGRCLACLHEYTIGSCNYGGNGDRGKDRQAEMRMKSIGLISGTPHDHKEPECNIHLAEVEMKEKLHQHFKSHIGKWKSKNRRRFPWKVILHVILLILVTTQVSITFVL